MRRFTLGLAVVCGLHGCSDFPDLDAVVSDRARDAPFPRLTQADRLGEGAAADRLSPEDTEELQSRGDDLRARADILRNLEVIDAETRRRVSDRLEALGG